MQLVGCALRPRRGVANSSPQDGLHPLFERFTTDKTNFAYIDFAGPALACLQPQLLNISLGRLVQAIQKQIDQMRPILLWKAQYSLFNGCDFHRAMLALNKPGFNVDVTGDRGKVRPKGADAHGRPC